MRRCKLEDIKTLEEQTEMAWPGEESRRREHYRESYDDGGHWKEASWKT